ncbi:glycosyltransferase family 4 protein [Aliikangiella sp. IMCC44632]
MRIISPVSRGNGAHVLHKLLESKLPDYRVTDYNPWITLFPPLLYPIGRRQQADIIHSLMDYGIFHKRSKIPLVLTLHNYVLDAYMSPFLSKLQNLHRKTDLKWLTQMSLRRADYLTAVSQYVADKTTQNLRLKKPIKVIYNGIDHQRFVPLEKTRSNSTKQIKVLFCGNLSKRKGGHWLPDIIRLLPENIIIQYTAGLRNIPDSFKHPRLVPLGKLEYADMHKLYQQADIFLFPTVREGFGLVVAEAMACQLPVVSSNCSAIPELVTHGKGGYLCETGNVAEYAKAIMLLADSPNLRLQMGQYNRAQVEQKFTLDSMLKNYTDFFQQVFEQSSV